MDGFGGGGFAEFGGVVQRDEGVGLGKVHGCAAFGDVIRDNEELVYAASLALVVGGDVDDLLSFEVERIDVCFVEEDDSTFALNSPVAIVETVDSGVVLVVATHGHEQ